MCKVYKLDNNGEVLTSCDSAKVKIVHEVEVGVLQSGIYRSNRVRVSSSEVYLRRTYAYGTSRRYKSDKK